MVIKREVAYGIVRGLSEFWKCEELQDFTVTLGTAQFGCHRLILAACSGFFRGLFRSGMKETELKCVSVEDISSETFEFILETMYTGRGVLTNENVIDIWKAVHQLQITFLILECEEFVIDTVSLENYIEYFKIGKLLNSKLVTERVWAFIIKNFSAFFKTRCFLELQMPEILKLVTCQDLMANSEDDVIYGILKWVEFTSHDEAENKINNNLDTTKIFLNITDSRIDERKDESLELCSQSQEKNISIDHEEISSNEKSDDKSHIICPKNHKKEDSLFTLDCSARNLYILLTKVRLCLASHRCLQMLLCYPLVKPNEKLRDIIVSALLYQLQEGKQNGQWPSGAIHRNNSVYANAALVYFKNRKDVQIKIYLFSRNIWLKLPKLFCEASSSVQFVFRGKSVYALGHKVTSHESKMHWSTEPPNRTTISTLFFKDGFWCDITVCLNLPSILFSAVVIESFIYIISHKGNEVWKLNPKTKTLERMADFPDVCEVSYVMCYEHLILVFYSCSNDGVDETAIDCLDTISNTWKRLNNLEGPAEDIISFRDDHSTYLLQSNGDLWKLVLPQSNIVDFEHVVKLWSCTWSLHGAVTFMDNLYIYGVKDSDVQNDPKLRKSVDGLFQNIIYMSSETTEKSTFLPVIVNSAEVQSKC